MVLEQRIKELQPPWQAGKWLQGKSLISENLATKLAQAQLLHEATDLLSTIAGEIKYTKVWAEDSKTGIEKVLRFIQASILDTIHQRIKELQNVPPSSPSPPV
jgi:hypothetical protein